MKLLDVENNELNVGDMVAHSFYNALTQRPMIARAVIKEIVPFNERGTRVILSSGDATAYHTIHGAVSTQLLKI